MNDKILIMENTPLTAYIYADHVVLQRAIFIEDGWFIKIYPEKIELWEIPLYGSGEADLVENFSSVEEAYKYAIKTFT